ncbi:JAB domain-containing protein [Sphingobium sp.]|uniref:JAB domain-containing protein n=1 Tax=Sphingobium sp. TaxID=1912891 RepID=UPI003B3A248D
MCAIIRHMVESDILLIAMLDDEWRPRGIMPLKRDWQGAFAQLLYTDAAWLALIQQRPVGSSPSPRPDDIMLTRMLARRLKPLDLKLADHVIHAGKARFSFRDAGLL